MNNHTEELTLWTVTISNHQQQGPGKNNPDLVSATYARNQKDAEQQLAAWFARHPERPYHTFTEQPYGYLVGVSTWLPGHIPIKPSNQTKPAATRNRNTKCKDTSKTE
jgi:hypothetical protein